MQVPWAPFGIGLARHPCSVGRSCIEMRVCAVEETGLFEETGTTTNVCELGVRICGRSSYKKYPDENLKDIFVGTKNQSLSIQG